MADICTLWLEKLTLFLSEYSWLLDSFIIVRESPGDRDINSIDPNCIYTDRNSSQKVTGANYLLPGELIWIVIWNVKMID